jgi:hypothetical protein
MKRWTMTLAAMAATATMAGPVAAQTPPAYGRGPSQSDFEICNREAELSAGSALPSAASVGRVPASPGLGATGGAPAGGSATGGPTSAAGATGATGSLSGGSTLHGGTASDPTLRGLAPGQTDPSHQQAYRDCMRRLGF